MISSTTCDTIILNTEYREVRYMTAIGKRLPI